MIRERVASDVHSANLAWDENYQKAIDRITALGMTDALGAELLRFKYANDRAAGARALHLLAHKAKFALKVELSYARSLAKAAIKEFLIDACDKCNGTGVIGRDKCSKCDGSGVKRYSDGERAMSAGFKPESWHGHAKKFDEVMTCMMGSVAETGGKLRGLLRDVA
jgi:hypothetical protein